MPGGTTAAQPDELRIYPARGRSWRSPVQVTSMATVAPEPSVAQALCLLRGMGRLWRSPVRVTSMVTVAPEPSVARALCPLQIIGAIMAITNATDPLAACFDAQYVARPAVPQSPSARDGRSVRRAPAAHWRRCPAPRSSRHPSLPETLPTGP